VAGTYTFRLTVTDNNGGTGIDDVKVIVNPATQNQLPIANAGVDITVTLPTNSVTLTGSASDADGNITSTVWAKVSGPTVTLVNQNTSTITLQSLVAGTYLFSFTITDNDGAIATDNIQVTVITITSNQIPTVTAGDDITISLPNNAVNLVAIANDPDGTIAFYAWTKQSGPAVTRAGETIPTLSLTNLLEGTYIFRITVTDDSGATSFDEVKITVLPLTANDPPVVNAGADKIIFLPTNATNLNGLASDADGTITNYLWAKMSGPSVTLANQSTPIVSLSNLVEGQYVFRLTATDNLGATGFDEVLVTIFPATVNQSPVANAGPDQTIVVPNSTIAFIGSGSDSDGTVVKFSWTKVSGPACILENISSNTLIVSNLLAGVYEFQLIVEDNDGAIGTDNILITIIEPTVNQPPVANAGLDLIINLPQSSLDIQGSGSDIDGAITSYLWEKKTGPASGTLSGQTTSKLSLTDLVSGSYLFILTVTDDKGLTASDEVMVTVIEDIINVNPSVTAGADLSIRLPISSLTLNAITSDPDGTIASFLWSKKSGPSATLSGANSSNLVLTNLVQGSYLFKIEVADNLGALGSDEVIVTVRTGTNLPPVVTAPDAISIVLPIASTTINGSVSDADGTVTSLGWTQQSGPSTATLVDTNSSTLQVSNLSSGVYTFRLTATDNENASAFAETIITVFASNTLPIASAGKDTTLLLPSNAIILEGSGKDIDGFITKYEWIQLQGPIPAINADELPQLGLTELTVGTYVFKLTITDNSGGSASDEVTIIVKLDKANPLGASIMFSPNGDNVNDQWAIKNLKLIENCPIFIFNRLGTKVFESVSYENNWDGTINGSQAIEGDYYYVCKCGTTKYSGAFRLLR
jgi:gliding motility-associated-like protein